MENTNNFNFEDKKVEYIQKEGKYLLLSFKNPKLSFCDDDYIYLLTDSKNIIEIEPCDKIVSTFEMDLENYIELKYYGYCKRVIHFPSNEVILDDEDVSYVVKIDDKVIEAVMKDNTKKLFNVKTKKYNRFDSTA